MRVVFGAVGFSVPPPGPMQYQLQAATFWGQPDMPPISGLKAKNWNRVRWCFSAKDSQVSPG